MLITVNSSFKRFENFSNYLKSSLFFYNLTLLDRHLKNICRIPADIWYALKANPVQCILNNIKDNQINFDVASIGELNQVLRKNILPNRILSTGPAKSKDYIYFFKKKGIKIFIIESIAQFLYIKSIFDLDNISVKILFRIQLKWKNKKENFLGGNSITPFGLEPNQWKSIFLKKYLYNRGNIIGFHCFQWGNIEKVNDLYLIWSLITKKIISLNYYRKEGIIDLGGGVGIPYSNKSKYILIYDLIKNIKGLKKKYNVYYWLELGRYITGEIGKYITSVTDVKRVYKKDILVMEGGSNNILRPSLTNQMFPVSLKRGRNKIKLKLYKEYFIHGPLCTSSDYLGNIKSHILNVGDSLLFHNVGAYGFTESMPLFLCHELSGELSIKNNKFLLNRFSTSPLSWLV